MKYVPVKLTKDYSYLVFCFEKEQEFLFLRKVLEYLHGQNDLYYYIFFGYSEFNRDIQKYKECYSELTSDHGFFKLKDEDRDNYQMISDILCNFQMASLYINKVPGLNQQYQFDDMRNSSCLFGGYVIDAMRETHIRILKSDDLPDWDLKRMGIYIDSDYQTSNPTDTPAIFSTHWQNENLIIEYTGIQTTRKGLQTGILSINEISFPEYRFGAPFLYSTSYLLVPIYLKTYFKTIWKLARIDLSDYSIELFGKGYPMIYLEEVDSSRAFFYTDLEKTISDFVKMPQMGKMTIE